ncbi:MAG TPA: hypothetical protein VK973_01205, partial [Arenicellales bacterium]|nr:hypothetical protein [Arenicellales bacterium]
HWNRIFAGAVLTTLLGVGAELAAPENRQDGNRIVIAGRDSAQDSINLDRPAFCRHPQAIIHGNSRGVYEQQAVHG